MDSKSYPENFSPLSYQLAVTSLSDAKTTVYQIYQKTSSSHKKGYMMTYITY